MKRKILVVDDDPHIREVAIFALEAAGMKTCEAKDGEEALTVFKHQKPDLVLLDVNMPERDGFDVCRELRKTTNTPILFLSSRSDEIDRVVGLEIGGDDYVTKPFSPRELTARVNAILKRTTPQANSPSGSEVLSNGKLLLDKESHIVLWDGSQIELTATEFAILKVMLERPKRVFERDDIMTIAYGPNIHVSDRTIDSHIRHIRDKFSSLSQGAIIETVRGVGYKLGSCN